MSDDLKVIDLRQATLANLNEQLRLLVEAVVAGNNRWIATNREIGELRGDIVRRLADLELRQGAVERRLNDVHSEVVTQSNQILNVQHDILRLLRERGVGERP